MGLFDSVGQAFSGGVKGVVNSLNPVENVKKFMKNPISGGINLIQTYSPSMALRHAGMAGIQGATGLNLSPMNMGKNLFQTLKSGL